MGDKVRVRKVYMLSGKCGVAQTTRMLAAII